MFNQKFITGTINLVTNSSLLILVVHKTQVVNKT